MSVTPSGRVDRGPDGRLRLVISRQFRSPIDDVWASVTEPERLARWIGTFTGDPASGRVAFRMTAEGDAPAEDMEIRECDPDTLWGVAQAHGGGVTEDELKDYIAKKSLAYGVMLGRVEVAEVQVDPKDLFPSFTPPQGFLYLSPTDYQRVVSAMFPRGIDL